MKYPQFAVMLATFALLATALPSRAQDTGFKGFLKRTAGAVLGEPSDATRPGTTANGTTVTDAPAYRPISPASGGTFEGIFRTYSPTGNPGKFPRVSLFFETFGASEACWRTRATIWTSEQSHHEETFDLCNAPIVTKDDLGATTIMADPTTTYLGCLAVSPSPPGCPSRRSARLAPILHGCPS